MLEDCIVEAKDLVNGQKSIVVYYIPDSETPIDEKALCVQMDKYTVSKGVTIDGYRRFEGAFPISSTTLKPQTRYTDGFVKYSSTGEELGVKYSPYEERDV